MAQGAAGEEAQALDPAIARGVYGVHTMGEAILLVLLDTLFLEGFAVHPSLAVG